MAQSKFKFIYLPAAAEMLGVQRSVISDLVKQGRLKVISGEGQQVVFRTADIERLAEELGLANPTTAAEALSDNPAATDDTPKKTRRPRDTVQKVSLRVASLKKWLELSDAELREWALAQAPITHAAIRRQIATIAQKLAYLQEQLNGKD